MAVVFADGRRGCKPVPLVSCQIGFNPLTDPRVIWQRAGLGRRARASMARAHREIRRKIPRPPADHQPLNPGDSIIIYGHSGRNASAIDAALHAKKRGLFVVAITSKNNLDKPARQEFGRTADGCRRRRHRHDLADRGCDRAGEGLEPPGGRFFDSARDDHDA
ncbi:SIS domain-containing protein [Aminobacter anthyllidis]|uniref:SIS domain-containing protein n=1 Tax=Aminobacter anthyllidis TaxID=1035067 RepID=A0A9X1A7X2_9HYPH|nr:SIS domain-containing protein [Aminobacter anthyllidis]